MNLPLPGNTSNHYKLAVGGFVKVNIDGSVNRNQIIEYLKSC